MKTDKKRKKLTPFDITIYIIALLAPLMTLPQLYNVWVARKDSGVSIVTWGTYSVISLFWVLYGLKHRQKPIILTNGLLLAVDSFIAIGVLIFR